MMPTLIEFLRNNIGIFVVKRINRIIEKNFIFYISIYIYIYIYIFLKHLLFNYI